jgi:hypothetical protein
MLIKQSMARDGGEVKEYQSMRIRAWNVSEMQ